MKYWLSAHGNIFEKEEQLINCLKSELSYYINLLLQEPLLQDI